MSQASTPRCAKVAPVTTSSLPMLLLRLRETVLLPLRPVIRRFDLTEQQARVLLVLEEAGPLEMAVLAKACCMLPPSLSRIVPKMRGRGLLDRDKPNADYRRVVVTLSPAGRDVAHDLRDALRAAFGELRQRIGLDGGETLAAEARVVLGALGDPRLSDMMGPEDDDVS